uniref:Bestrophin homolog n=1 Tax=Globisporangium ultimum (strain ATCC 200006 / CBS 805.95 / DAOM BR144) TaxID=431595 RepID=K3X9Y5_GLOUD
MIYYETDQIRDVIFRWHGSALNGPAPVRAVFMALFALCVAAVNDFHPFVVPTRESTAFVDTLTVFNTFLGLTISFRLNSAFQQWRSGVVTVGSLTEAARGIVASGCAYVSATLPINQSAPAKTDEGDNVRSPQIPRDIMEKCTFFSELRRLVFLYIAIVFHDCRGRDGIDKMRESAILTESEFDEMYACGTEQSKHIVNKESYQAVVQKTPHKLRATIVELWLKRLVEVAAQRGHLSPVNANNLQLKIAQLPSLYTTVFNIANVPIPFNYFQYLHYLIIAYMMLYTFVIVPRSGYYTPLWVFGWGMFLFTADQVAMEIECPFGLDANDIDLEARLLHIEEELTVLIRSQYYFISGGASLTRLQGQSTDSWKTTFNSKPTTSTKAPETVKESFSFHQGRVSEEAAGFVTQDSLPEIDEYTALITQAKSSTTGSSYGSSKSMGSLA